MFNLEITSLLTTVVIMLFAARLFLGVVWWVCRRRSIQLALIGLITILGYRVGHRCVERMLNSGQEWYD